MDEVDLAQDAQEAELRRLITAQAYAIPQGASAEECEDCGKPIPGERRKAAPGCTRCVRCQKLFELRMRGK